MTDFAWWMLMLARTPETWAVLLAGEAVNPDDLDPEWLRRAQALRLVKPDISMFEHLFGEREAA